jgi:hypothetical protein
LGLVLLTAMNSAAARGDDVLAPKLAEPAWQVAGDPDLGPWTKSKQQPVDFAVWQAADGSWQLWSCIRGTVCGGNTRLFFRWESPSLTAADWKPMGIAMTADPALDETPGGLQAPHVIRVGEAYWMFYGDWQSICLATSRDGKQFERVLNDRGRPQLFSEDRPGNRANTRDAMVLPIGDRFYCYYTAYPNQQGAVYRRTSTDLRRWSDSQIVAFGGSAGTNPYSAECPHVVRHDPSGCYYLFRTQRYGRDAQTSVYRSPDPLGFGIDDDRLLVARLPLAAPEIIHHDGQWYIASLLPSLKGIQIARMEWVASGR